MRACTLWLPLVALAALVACGGEDAAPTTTQAATGPGALPVDTDFLRFVEHPDESAALEVAIVGYTRDDGARVDLIGAVHLGDRAYYDDLQKRFTTYDALLYELVAPEPGARPRKGGSDSIVSRLQRFMSSTLELEFQLEGVDYDQPNFVHADLTIDEFQRLMDEKGESLWKIMLRMMAAQYAAQQKGEGSQLNSLAVLMTFALGGKSRARGLKLMLAREFENIEAMMAGLEPKEPGKESVLLGERNKAAIGVLEAKLAEGSKHLGIFYGAAHMPDLEARLLRDLGFRKAEHTWVTAWSIVKP